MDLSGPAPLADLLGDNIAFRNLRPADPRIAFRPPRVLPRKIDRSYATAVAELLTAARAVEQPGQPIRNVVVIGDNAGTDGVMFHHLRQLLPGDSRGLIVDETGAPSVLDVADPFLARADGWAMVRRWAAWLDGQGVSVDQATAIVLDVDKTLLGPRGRNGGVIDETRRRAMEQVIRLAGDCFNAAAFDAALATFNVSRFHHFTGDNQDYVAALCLLVAHGIRDLDELVPAIDDGSAGTLASIIARAVESPRAVAVRPLLHAIQGRIAAGDPTPFKVFREQEYVETVRAMGHTSGDDVASRLRDELCLCGEVLDVAGDWQARGALLFALSDKPDEAALPTAELHAAGWLPIHRVPTHIIRAGARPTNENEA